MVPERFVSEETLGAIPEAIRLNLLERERCAGVDA